jgi:hypothetical protein
MTAVTIAIAVTGCVVACNVAVSCWATATRLPSYGRKKRRSKQLSRPYRQRRCLARHQEHDGYAIVQRTPAERALARCLSRFNGLNEGESWLWKTQLTMSILSSE